MRQAIRPLQWGRVRMNAEVAQMDKAGTTDEEASMGPRSNERGSAAARMSTEEQQQLQWGRVRMNAEVLGDGLNVTGSDASMGPRSNERGSSMTRALKNLVGTLQWGRVRMNAEVAVAMRMHVNTIELQW